MAERTRVVVKTSLPRMYRGQVAGARGGMQKMNGAVMGAMSQGTKMVATRLK